jgi:hypothetical protein
MLRISRPRPIALAALSWWRSPWPSGSRATRARPASARTPSAGSCAGIDGLTVEKVTGALGL